MDRTDLLWRRFELHVALFKHYLDLTLKINVAFYAISGAVVSYVLAHPGDRTSQAGLLIPLILGVGLTTVSMFGALMLGETRKDLLSIRDGSSRPIAPPLGVFRGLFGGCDSGSHTLAERLTPGACSIVAFCHRALPASDEHYRLPRLTTGGHSSP
jgi:hypothetical protein